MQCRGGFDWLRGAAAPVRLKRLCQAYLFAAELPRLDFCRTCLIDTALKRNPEAVFSVFEHGVE